MWFCFLFCKLPIKFHSGSLPLDGVLGLSAKACFMGILVIRITEVTRRAGRALPLDPRFPLNHLVFLWASFKLCLLKQTEVLVQ